MVNAQRQLDAARQYDLSSVEWEKKNGRRSTQVVVDEIKTVGRQVVRGGWSGIPVYHKVPPGEQGQGGRLTGRRREEERTEEQWLVVWWLTNYSDACCRAGAGPANRNELRMGSHQRPPPRFTVVIPIPSSKRPAGCRWQVARWRRLPQVQPTNKTSARSSSSSFLLLG